MTGLHYPERTLPDDTATPLFDSARLPFKIMQREITVPRQALELAAAVGLAAVACAGRSIPAIEYGAGLLAFSQIIVASNFEPIQLRSRAAINGTFLAVAMTMGQAFSAEVGDSSGVSPEDQAITFASNCPALYDNRSFTGPHGGNININIVGAAFTPEPQHYGAIPAATVDTTTTSKTKYVAEINGSWAGRNFWTGAYELQPYNQRKEIDAAGCGEPKKQPIPPSNGVTMPVSFRPSAALGL